MIIMPIDQLDLSMSLIEPQEYSGQSIQVPNYGDALKTIFAGEMTQIFLHVTRLPCDPSHSLVSTVTPSDILRNNHFKPHPKGNGLTYYKNYSNSDEKNADVSVLSQTGFFRLKETTLPKNGKPSLLVTFSADPRPFQGGAS